jgi:hypothetical protein
MKGTPFKRELINTKTNKGLNVFNILSSRTTGAEKFKFA